MTEAYEEGRKVGILGQDLDNSYDDINSDQYYDWSDGWEDGYDEYRSENSLPGDDDYWKDEADYDQDYDQYFPDNGIHLPDRDLNDFGED